MFLPFISSAFVPTETMPAAVRRFAENQPVTGVVNTIRALLNARSVGSDIWVAPVWRLGIGGLFWALATRAYARGVNK
jgi:ABC-2 type transport system permease protein